MIDRYKVVCYNLITDKEALSWRDIWT